MKLFVTRHGQTLQNAAGIVQGHLPGELSPMGQEQAKKVALRLQNEKFDIIYSSDLKRAADTAKEIAKFHSGVPFILTKEMRELHEGERQGKKISDIGMWISKEGESLDELYQRAKLFLDEVKKKHKDHTVLLVGHEDIDNALFAVIEGREPHTIRESGLKNTSISVYEIDAQGYKQILFNDVQHLL